ncbi:ABC transporter ATP-binding protein [Flammeovirga pectinis]|uniref:ABC transporter ATP-binding protein n=1 Tax=Flammeovirga pectinis TaxID=2494373 RepID=A0A3Q9FUL0_9BACT|nr:ABC transporter ATP-binding protein [Flammeovirga pectinis]AZQ64756.1 ABC transporter ATP-binding protein [Flammeovirga pectinis]
MIKIKNLKKVYNSHKVLDILDIHINPGSIYTLIGKNGEGKSTLLNAILDLITIDEGLITINGKPVTKLTTIEKRNIGVLQDQLNLIEEVDAYTFLKYIAQIYKVPKEVIDKRIQDLLDLFFEDKNKSSLNQPILTYSTGMKKKIAFCAAVIHTPDLLILDEPFTGLDLVSANNLCLFLKKYINNERCIFISSHNINYIEKISTDIGILIDSKITFSGEYRQFITNQSLYDELLKWLNIDVEETQLNLDWL